MRCKSDQARLGFQGISWGRSFKGRWLTIGVDADRETGQPSWEDVARSHS